MTTKQATLFILAAAILLMSAALFLVNPIPQPESYHQFADRRTLHGIPHFWNVVSNIPFALAGLWGLFLLLFTNRVHFIDSRERWLWTGVSVGLILTAMGSTYYHLDPANSRLLWDRLAMVTVFMSIVAAMIGERIHIRLGLWLWPLLIAAGFLSVFAWYASESHGNSNLSFYIGIQLLAMLVLLVMLFTPSPYTRSTDLGFVLLCYALALLFEFTDHQVYRLTGGVISGHTLKHLSGALAGALLIWMIWKRKIKESDK